MNKTIIYLESIFDIDKINNCLKDYVQSYNINLENNSITIYTEYIFEIQFVCDHLVNNGYQIIDAKMLKDMEAISLIEVLDDKKTVDKAILDENERFDLEKFFVQDLDGAVGVITKNKIIFASAMIDHYKALNAIYNLLYNFSSEMKDYYSFSDNVCWQEEAVKFGNVIIQLCSNAYSSIWLPDELNIYQRQKLKEITDRINSIKQKYNISISIEVGKPSDILNGKIETLHNKIN